MHIADEEASTGAKEFLIAALAKLGTHDCGILRANLPSVSFEVLLSAKG